MKAEIKKRAGKRIGKAIRKMLYEKYGGRCAYCGVLLPERFHADHIHPVLRGGLDDIHNLNPACARCNNWKLWFTVDEFRVEIAAQPGRLMRDSAGFRLARDYEQLDITTQPVIFYFERFTDS